MINDGLLKGHLYDENDVIIRQFGIIEPHFKSHRTIFYKVKTPALKNYLTNFSIVK